MKIVDPELRVHRSGRWLVRRWKWSLYPGPSWTYAWTRRGALREAAQAVSILSDAAQVQLMLARAREIAARAIL